MKCKKAGMEKKRVPGLSEELCSYCANGNKNESAWNSPMHCILKCPVCSTDIQQIISKGQAGCPHCYRIFGRDISRLFPNRVPYRSLQRELQSAISSEDFEYAALLRDRMNEFIGN